MRQWPQRRQRHARIEIIPMIDVMMFLLVFFVLISINVLPALGLKITPPSSAKPDRVVERTRITIGIDKDGNTFLDGKPVPMAELAERLRAPQGEKAPAVMISGDAGAGLQALVSVLDELKKAGVSGAQIVTKPR